MKIKNLYIAMVALLMAGCSEAEIDNGQQQKGLMPVLFSAGNTDIALTRGESAAYMPKESRFVCSMFFHAGADDKDEDPFYTDQPAEDVNMVTTWLKINNTTGNAVYWNKEYNDATTGDYGFDVNAKYFYWQNRKNHIFLALTDNNNLTKDNGNGGLKLYPYATASEKAKAKYMLEYDLTRGNKESMAEQPDPILAVDTISPLGGTPEANRVKLFFKHQFAQVQVNLKNSQEGSVNITDNSKIDKVELLGVAETAYVPYCIQADGKVEKATAEPIKIDDSKYDATREDNKYGSSFSLFARDVAIPGYLKTFEGIVFGTLKSIRVTWTEPDSNITHTADVKSVESFELESGKKYIYNIELRRSTIAQVIPQVVDWDSGKTYSAEGTIKLN